MFATLSIVLLMGASDLVTANTDTTYEPGFVEWSITPHERLYVEGANVEEAVLQRGQTDSAVGGFTVGVTNGPVPVFTLQSPPVEQPVETEVFMSCLLYTSPSPRDVEESRMPSSA